ncbi:hypothetical protein BJX70DRAFT_26523 [Aspergillus crustosus]
MENTFLRALTRALPSVGRQVEPSVSVFRQARAFSSTSSVFDSELEKILSPRPPKPSARDDSPISNITRNMASRGKSVSEDLARIAESVEQNVLRAHDNSPPHHLHVYSHRHNTHLCLTRPNGSPMLSMSCGNLGFRKGKRGGYDAGYQLTSHVFAQIQERGLLMNMRKLEINYRGFQQGREAFNKVLLANEGKHIRAVVSQVTDSTRIKFGGTRSPRVRRLG